MRTIHLLRILQSQSLGAKFNCLGLIFRTLGSRVPISYSSITDTGMLGIGGWVKLPWQRWLRKRESRYKAETGKTMEAWRPRCIGEREVIQCDWKVGCVRDPGKTNSQRRSMVQYRVLWGMQMRLSFVSIAIGKISKGFCKERCYYWCWLLERWLTTYECPDWKCQKRPNTCQKSSQTL